MSNEDGTIRQTIFEYECSRLARNIAEVGDARLDDPENWDLSLTDTEHAHAQEAIAPLDVGGRGREQVIGALVAEAPSSAAKS